MSQALVSIASGLRSTPAIPVSTSECFEKRLLTRPDTNWRLETSASTPNLGNLGYNLSSSPPAEEDDLPSSRATTKRSSSSASDAVHGDLPSPLEHISQQAAAFRSRAASGGTIRARHAEVARRIDLMQARRAAAAAEEPEIQMSPLSSPTSPTFPGTIMAGGRKFTPLYVRNSVPNFLTDVFVPEDDLPPPTMRHRRSNRARRAPSGAVPDTASSIESSTSKPTSQILALKAY